MTQIKSPALSSPAVEAIIREARMSIRANGGWPTDELAASYARMLSSWGEHES